MQTPKLIVSDIDGVIALEGVLEGRLVLVFARLQQADVFCTVATGRGYLRTKRCFGPHYEPNCPMILENGGRICDATGTSTYTRPISRLTCQEVREFMTPRYVEAVDFFQLHDHRYVLLRHPQFAEPSGTPFLDESQIEARYDTVDAFVAHLNRTRCCKLTFFRRRNVKVPFPNIVNWSRNENYYTVMAWRISKGAALRRLCRQLRIPLESTLVAGNDFNDLELFGLPARWRVAVGKDCPELKRLATDHVRSPAEYAALLKELFRMK